MRTLLCTTLILLATSTHAQSPKAPAMNYDYLEVRFVDVDVAGGDGLVLGGSLELDQNWFVLGGISLVNFDGDVDSTNLAIGGGYVIPWQQDWDIVLSAQFLHTDVDTPFGGDDDSGLGLSGGLRGFIVPKFEVRGSVNHTTVGDSDTFIEIAGDYYFTPQFAAGLSTTLAGDVDTLSIGARWFFR